MTATATEADLEPVVAPVTPTVTLRANEKVALVLMQMNQEAAAEVMRHFSDAEAQLIAGEMVKLKSVDPEAADVAINDFYELTASGRTNPRGGRDFAVNLLEASLGSEKAAGVMDRLASSMAGRSFEFLDDMDPGQIGALLDGEHAQTIALVLAHLKAATAAQIVAALDDSVRGDVSHAIAKMTTASPDAVKIVSESLRARIGASLTTKAPVEVVGGVMPLVEIINRSDVATEKAILEALEARDHQLAEDVRARMLVFADIIKFEQRAIQAILRGVDPVVLAKAMKGSSDAVKAAIEANLTERNKEMLAEEAAGLGRLRMSEVEEARAEVVRRIRELEESGQIEIQRGEDDYVY